MPKRGPILTIAFFLMAALLPPVAALQAEERPLPRFASLKSSEVNVRTGPGIRYPIRWVYKKKWLPMEIVEEYDHWRKVRDVSGETGWVHRSLLSGHRTIHVTDETLTLRREPNANAAPVLRAERGVTGDLIECDTQWCRLQIADRKGWAIKTSFWGAYDSEIFD